MKRRVTATVRGLVQGVFFRQTTTIEATRLGLVGTVRNLPDGTVRVLAEGEERELRDLLEWLGHGPERAVVESVDVQWLDARDEEREFRVEG